ncbi:zinc finger Y-chromosomal protein-like [Polymixia lowei]
MEERRGAERREVGCQSEGVERRDAAVQVNLLPQLPSWNTAGSSSVMLQCIGVRPDQSGGGALLQSCTINTSGSTSTSVLAVGPVSTNTTQQTTTLPLLLLTPIKHTPTLLRPSQTQQDPNRPRPSSPVSSTTCTPSLLPPVLCPPLSTPSLLPPVLCPPLSTPSLLPPVLCPPLSTSPSSSPPPSTSAPPPEEEEDRRRDPDWHLTNGDPDDQLSSSISVEVHPSNVAMTPSLTIQSQTVKSSPFSHRSDTHPEQPGQRAVPVPRVFVCHVCRKVLKCKSSLRRHSLIHTGEKAFACQLCSTRFNRLSNLQQHLRRMHPGGACREERRPPEPRAWLCELCGKAFDCRSRLKAHAVVHTGVKPHACPLCPKAYVRAGDLQYHKKTVHVGGAERPPGPRPLLCDRCGKEFKCRSQLALHVQTHTGDKPHLCDLCGRRFARLHQLRRHKILVHVGRAEAGEAALPETPFVCHLCGKHLKSRSLLAAHSHVHSGDEPQSFRRASHLQQHQVLLHVKVKAGEGARTGRCGRDGAPQSVCQVCGKAFKFKSWLAAHAIVHTALKPHVCQFCDRTFRRPSHLKRHLDGLHTDGARGPLTPASYVCEVCGKDGKSRSGLERHAIIHTGERPYACHLCSSRFNRRGNLQQHLKHLHAGQAPPPEAPARRPGPAP